jgi:YgiT-type zinc finger domain-containing protein
MECIYCKGEMTRKTAPFSIQRQGYYLHWDAIPAWVCEQCGEAAFEAHEVDLIQKALADLDRKNIEFKEAA